MKEKQRMPMQKEQSASNKPMVDSLYSSFEIRSTDHPQPVEFLSATRVAATASSHLGIPT